MKNVLLFIVIVFIVFGFAYTWHYLNTYTNFNKIDPKTECIEDGNCKEGLSIKVDKDKTIIINKDTCLENNGNWYEETKMCIF